MSRIVMVLVGFVLAGCASSGWRALRIDGTSEARFTASLTEFQETLNEQRRYILERSLLDVWIVGAGTAADAHLRGEEASYTPRDYLDEVDGLGYAEIVELADPSGERTKRYREILTRTHTAGWDLHSPGIPVAFEGALGGSFDSIAMNAGAYGNGR